MVEKEPNSFKEIEAPLKAIAESIIDHHKNDEACQNYDPEKSRELSNLINKEIIESFAKKYPTYKFCSSCLILSNKEGGAHYTNSCYWEEKLDGNIQLTFNEWKAIKVIVSVFVVF